MSENKVTKKDFLFAIIFIIICIFAIIGFSNIFFSPDPPPIKGNDVNIDSLLNTNDSIKVTIKYIDSIKHEEIEKVLNLSNDSTVELFKQLVKE